MKNKEPIMEIGGLKYGGFHQDSHADLLRELELDQTSPLFNPLKLRALQIDGTKNFQESIKERIIDEQKNITLSCKGKPRTGKSLSVMGIYKYICDLKQEFVSKKYKPDIRDIIWTQEQLIYNKKYYLEKGRTLIVDEDYRRNSGIGISSVNEAIDDINNTLGVTGINILYVGVETQQANVYYKLLSESYDRKLGINKLFVLNDEEQPAYHIRIKAYKIDGYDEQKEKFTKSVIHNENRKMNEYLTNLSDNIIKELGEEIYLFSNEALRGFIRKFYAKEGLQENQLWAIFSMCLAEKTHFKIKNKDKLLKEKNNQKLEKEKQKLEKQLEEL